jgi:hypothetical protein
MMHRGGTMASVARDLYDEVAHHKFVFGDDKHASEAPANGIRIVPAGDLLFGLEADYRNMQPMFFTNPAPPSFEAMIAELRILEAKLKAL